MGWKLAASDLYREECLYDLENDPHERHNQVREPQHAELRCELAQTLKRRMAAAGEDLQGLGTSSAAANDALASRRDGLLAHGLGNAAQPVMVSLTGS